LVWHSQLHTSKISIYATRPPKTGWVIEADGAARAAIYALHKSGVEKMFISNRTQSRAEAIASKFADQFHVEVVEAPVERGAVVLMCYYLKVLGSHVLE
jgi:shikimate 5-dehydrogenase